ncbi:MAG: dTMP kinase [Microcystaceae cyanobacterium]
MTPLFIVLEGIDGSGTSTQAELLQTYFINHQQKAILSPEPSEGIIGQLIRKGMQSSILDVKDSHHFDQQMAYLFAADRYHHLYNEENGVFKSIKQDKTHVITTRYYFSSFAYNGYTQEDWELIARLNHNFPNPDLVVYCDLPVEVSLLRIQDRSTKEIYETKEKLTQVRHNYHRLFKDYSGKLLIVDATQATTEINQAIINYLKDNFDQEL